MPLPQALIRVPGDYFYQPDSSSARSFLPQGLFRPVRFISSLLFFSTGIISIGQIHLWFALFPHRDYFYRSDSSLACSFSPQGLFLSARFISGLLFCSAGIIPAARIHPQSALFLHRDYFGRPDSSPACSFSPQGLFLSARFISGLLFSSAGIISAGQIHPYKQISSAADAFSAKYPSENVRHWTHTGKSQNLYC